MPRGIALYTIKEVSTRSCKTASFAAQTSSARDNGEQTYSYAGRVLYIIPATSLQSCRNSLDNERMTASRPCVIAAACDELRDERFLMYTFFVAHDISP